MSIPSLPGEALALAGHPPVGLGVYDRSHDHDAGPWLFHVAYPGSARAGDWVFVGVDAMRPESWRGALEHALDVAGSRFAAGVVVNPETGWSDAPPSEWAALAAALRAGALRTRIGLVSHSGWPVERLASQLAGLVWGSVELFGEPATNARAWARWRAAFGLRLIPTITTRRGVLHPPSSWSTSAGYRAYVQSIPSAGGAIVWPGYPLAQDEADALRERYASASAAFVMLPLALASAADTWSALVVAVLVVLAILIGARAR